MNKLCFPSTTCTKHNNSVWAVTVIMRIPQILPNHFYIKNHYDTIETINEKSIIFLLFFLHCINLIDLSYIYKLFLIIYFPYFGLLKHLMEEFTAIALAKHTLALALQRLALFNGVKNVCGVV